MARISVITDSYTALGFRLAGVDAFDASSGRDAEVLIERFLRNREYAKFLRLKSIFHLTKSLNSSMLC